MNPTQEQVALARTLRCLGAATYCDAVAHAQLIISNALPLPGTPEMRAIWDACEPPRKSYQPEAG